MNKLIRAVLILALITIAAGCANPPQVPTPTPIEEALPSPSATPQPTASATPTPTAALQIAQPTDVPTQPVTDEPAATPTPSVVEYVIQPDDTLIYIIQQFGYRDLAVLGEIVRINSNLPSADRLPGPGNTILIPLPTIAPTLPADVQTATAMSGIPQVSLAIQTTIVPHIVRDGETILGIAEQYRTTLRVLRDLNPQIGFFNCDLSNPSGGPDCTVLLDTGAAVNVPAPTPTPTLSPTPSGNETATPTPTFAAPRISFPPRDAAINAASTFTLQWVSVGVLEAQQVYLIQIENLASGTAFNDITRATSYRLPAEIAPANGERQQYRWRVSVAQQNADGRYAVVGAEGEWRTFTWGSGS